jgi:tetratricopeptide (TPR) repeat protein
MATVRAGLNWRLRAAREGLGLNQSKCAAALEKFAWDAGKTEFRCYPLKVRRWEAGVQPHPYAHPVLAGFFKKTPAELGIGAAAQACTPDASSPTVEGNHPALADQEDAEMKRRQLAAGAAALAGLPVLERLSLPAMSAFPIKIGPREIDRLHDSAHTFSAIGNVRGGEFARAAIVAEMQWSSELLNRPCPAKLRGALFSAVGHLAIAGGYAMFDACDHDNARRVHRFGVACAEEAQDWSLRAQMLSNMARHATMLNDPDEALTFVELALVRPDRLGATELARLHSARAKALGQLGNVDEALRAIGASDEAFARRDPANDPSWMGFYDQATQLTDTGSALAELELRGHRTDAGERLARAITTHGDARARARTVAQTRLATVMMLNGDPHEAAAVGNAALDAAAPIRSRRIAAYLTELADHAQPHTTIPAVSHLRSRIAPT